MKMLERAAARLRSLFTRPASDAFAVPLVRRVTIEATIIRANGDIEPFGIITSSGGPA